MSDELLQRFLTAVEEEDGIALKLKRKKKNNSNGEKDYLKKVLRAAEKGKVDLEPEESYILHAPSTSRVKEYFDDRGFSLVEQARSHKPRDLKNRNLKYIKYVESRKLDGEKAKKLVAGHLATKEDKSSIRKLREQNSGLKEPRRILKGSKEAKPKDESVFSDADFAVISRRPRRVNTISDHSFL
ncbi:unnamed protein product [Caenorhabditis auriculariae]|uniref:Uncharacterized protein n=1 Tax=Caenorhabditis auriculariae TaxID=2777116 RepID=A0A8S1H2I9_9PELO|nr:unnamed protein product [Caenorhabditis auriculariae]